VFAPPRRLFIQRAPAEGFVRALRLPTGRGVVPETLRDELRSRSAGLEAGARRGVSLLKPKLTGGFRTSHGVGLGD